MEKTSFDPSKRRLCPDGVCIGVIGSDGRCRVCGRSDDGRPLAAVSADAPPDDMDDADDVDDTVEAADREREDAPVAAGAFDPKRRLCDDGTCVGVIGPDGTCSVCGQKASAEA
jgi:hypothetical protein